MKCKIHVLAFFAYHSPDVMELYTVSYQTTGWDNMSWSPRNAGGNSLGKIIIHNTIILIFKKMQHQNTGIFGE